MKTCIFVRMKKQAPLTEIELTADGSHTLFVPSMNEHYHSVNGAATESMHIFIQTGLQQCHSDAINILEIGFGTGLNAFLTLLEAEKLGKKIHFTTSELYPLAEEVITHLNYPATICPQRAADYYQLHFAAWEKDTEITKYFILHKWEGDANKPSSIFSYKTYDVVYFDAFAPDKQPEMWTQELFNTIYAAMNENGILTTYCAKGVVRRMLQAAGFTTERLPGPPGKREMLRGRKIVKTNNND